MILVHFYSRSQQVLCQFLEGEIVEREREGGREIVEGGMEGESERESGGRDGGRWREIGRKGERGK